MDFKHNVSLITPWVLTQQASGLGPVGEKSTRDSQCSPVSMHVHPHFACAQQNGVSALKWKKVLLTNSRPCILKYEFATGFKWEVLFNLCVFLSSKALQISLGQILEKE
jgi:hypothetical protein